MKREEPVDLSTSCSIKNTLAQAADNPAKFKQLTERDERVGVTTDECRLQEAPLTSKYAGAQPGEAVIETLHSSTPQNSTKVFGKKEISRKCPYCSQEWHNLENLQVFRDHLQTVHESDIGPCKNCSVMCSNTAKQIEHLVFCNTKKTSGPNLPYWNPTYHQEADSKYRAVGNGSFTCKICGKNTQGLAIIRQHVKKCEGLECHSCGQRIWMIQLFIHGSSHCTKLDDLSLWISELLASGKYFCGIGPCKFQGSRRHLYHHKLQAHPDQPPEIKHSSSPNSMVRRDVTNASKMLMYYCTHCPAKFWGPYQLRNHLSVCQAAKLSNRRYKPSSTNSPPPVVNIDDDDDDEEESKNGDTKSAISCGMKNDDKTGAISNSTAPTSDAVEGGIDFDWFRVSLATSNVVVNEFYCMCNICFSVFPDFQAAAGHGSRHHSVQVAAAAAVAAAGETSCNSGQIFAVLYACYQCNSPLASIQQLITHKAACFKGFSIFAPGIVYVNQPSKMPPAGQIDNILRNSSVIGTRPAGPPAASARHARRFNGRALGDYNPFPHADDGASAMEARADLFKRKREDSTTGNGAPSTKGKVVKCVICYETITGEVADHVNTHKVLLKDQELFRCPWCTSVSKRLKTILSHIQSDHKDMIKAQPGPKLQDGAPSMQASDSPIDDEIEVVGEVCGPGNFQRQAEPTYGMARLGPPATPPHLPLPSSCDTEASSLMSMPGQSTSSESSPVPKKMMRNKAEIDSADEGSDTSAETSEEDSDCDVVEKVSVSGKRTVTKHYICQVCGNKSVSRDKYLKHMSTLSVGKASRMTSAGDLSSAKAQKLYLKCGRCPRGGYVASKVTDLEDHYQRTHKALTRDCPFCEEYTTGIPLLFGHHIKFKKHSISKNQVLCQICQNAFSNYKNFRGHLYSKHNVQTSCQEDCYFYVVNLKGDQLIQLLEDNLTS